MNPLGKLLIIMGVVMVIAGVVIIFWDKIPFLGKLPGDIVIRKKNFTFYFPLATSIILSILISLILFLINRFR